MHQQFKLLAIFLVICSMKLSYCFPTPGPENEAVDGTVEVKGVTDAIVEEKQGEDIAPDPQQITESTIPKDVVTAVSESDKDADAADAMPTLEPDVVNDDVGVNDVASEATSAPNINNVDVAPEENQEVGETAQKSGTTLAGILTDATLLEETADVVNENVDVIDEASESTVIPDAPNSNVDVNVVPREDVTEAALNSGTTVAGIVADTTQLEETPEEVVESPDVANVLSDDIDVEDSTSAPKPETTVAEDVVETSQPESVNDGTVEVAVSPNYPSDDLSVVSETEDTTPAPQPETTPSPPPPAVDAVEETSKTPLSSSGVESLDDSTTPKPSLTATEVSKTTSNDVAPIMIENQIIQESTQEPSSQGTTEKTVQAVSTVKTAPDVASEDDDNDDEVVATQTTPKVTDTPTSTGSLHISTEALPENSEIQGIPVADNPTTQSITTTSPIATSTTTSGSEPLILAVKDIPSEKVDQDSIPTTTSSPQPTTSSPSPSSSPASIPSSTTSSDTKLPPTTSINDASNNINVAMETTTRNDPTPDTTSSTDFESTTTTDIKKPLLKAVGPPQKEEEEPSSPTSPLPTTQPPTTQAVSSQTTTVTQSNDTGIVLTPARSLEFEIFEAKRDNVDDVDTHRNSAAESESDDPQNADLEIVNVTLGAPVQPKSTKIPFLLDLEKAEKEQDEDGSGDGDSHEDDHDHHSDEKDHHHHHHGDGDDDDHHTGAAHHGDTPEDRENKKRTAIIVGVAVGGVALFTLGFFTSRHCRKYSRNIGDKKPSDRDTIEFVPLNTSHPGIYDDMEARNPNGLYRQGPKMGPPSPRMHRKNEGKFEFPEVHKSSGPTLEVPKRPSQPSGSSQSLSDDDELDASPREQLLPSNGKSPETTQSTSPTEPEGVESKSAMA